MSHYRLLLCRLGPTPFDVAVTPHIGFGPYFTTSWTITSSGGSPQFSQASVEVGAEVFSGEVRELQLLLGLGSVGLDGTVLATSVSMPPRMLLAIGPLQFRQPWAST